MLATTPPASLRTGKILIVDDETKILKLLSRYFSRHGHDVRTTTEPREALRLVQAERYDVLVLDHRMPELTGLELFKRVLRLHEGATPEIILMTAHATVEKAVETMKLGAVDYIQKPFDFDSMKEAIRKALERREDRRERLGTGPGASPGGLGGPATTGQPERSEREDRPELIGESPAMKELIGISRRSPQPTRRCSSRVRQEREKSWLPQPFTGSPSAARNLWLASTAPRSPRGFSRAKCSATSGERSPEPHRTGAASSPSLTVGVSSWMRSPA